MMKEIPILFSTPMVQAILEGRKTQTRRIAAVPVGGHHGTDIMDWGLSKHPYQENGKWLYHVQSDVDDHDTFELRPKCGQVGDLLWVRETHAVTWSTGPKMKRTTWYKADNPAIPERVSFKWKPSIHMPKGEARIWLKVTDVRVERLRDISEEDAIAEGVEKLGDFVFPYKHYAGENSSCIDAKTSFQSLWQKINGDESWAANPWVWCLSFKILSTTGKPNPCPKS